MKNLFQIVFLCFICVLLSSCALKTKIQSQSTYIILKTPQIKFADYGFLYEGKNLTKLEFYNSSKVLFELKITDKICINGVCYTKILFNKRFFNYEYYDDFLQDLILKKPIFYGKNKQITSCGFTQKIMSKNYDIFYEVCNGYMSFNEKKSKVKFSMKSL
ncbi:hypothetical protein A7X81_06730 [Campylobacter ornithocola]|uniref:Uncharacterized protein n=1 Tax=Campylobacter ornithocola TaxID=1848766 RepID=A0A6M8MZC9_9BACT|nr:hypothetical protein [Campylobacter ornithocola]OCX42904.1 hypothetical protein A7X81_06730 [Campylobacter ornithocola]QKF58118.1 putative lipoprotein [Campylobacter ornithocola]